MIKIIKKIFTKKNHIVSIQDSPGRTFKRILTGRYFGCEDKTADEAKMSAEKQDKINQIQELELIPMYVKYSYVKNTKSSNKIISAAHVAFQKETLAKKWNMLHVTEVSFTVYAEDFDEFERMSGVVIQTDFRDVTPTSENTTYNGEERRKEKRDY